MSPSPFPFASPSPSPRGDKAAGPGDKGPRAGEGSAGPGRPRSPHGPCRPAPPGGPVRKPLPGAGSRGCGAPRVRRRPRLGPPGPRPPRASALRGSCSLPRRRGEKLARSVRPLPESPKLFRVLGGGDGPSHGGRGAASPRELSPAQWCGEAVSRSASPTAGHGRSLRVSPRAAPGPRRGAGFVSRSRVAQVASEGVR